MNITTLIYAFLGGILPATIWLIFWLRQDKEKPEPKLMIMIAFIGGIIAVFGSLYLERLCSGINIKSLLSTNFLNPLLIWIENISLQEKISLNKLFIVIFFAPIIEESLKFIMAYFVVLRSKDDDESIDPMIYMITVALGFAAIENMLFLIDPLTRGNITTGVLTGNMRFIGATLLHTVSSVIVGMFIGFNFFDKKMSKLGWTLIGLACAIITHILFNFFMIGSARESLMALEVIWIAVIIVLLAFEKIKKIKLERI
ncbi:MAG: PrsW family glutamic-type intramembrane protease [Candidatus Pacebacteria bacterium]|nr:PrsW family glutamic-type intramembrane protease [Candidatus Paceibacterota bacterium]